MKILLSISVLFASFFQVQAQSAQSIAASRSIVDTLTSPYFWGRGYTNNGMKKAADYLVNEFKQHKLLCFGKSYSQPFTFNVNSFPGNMQVSINDKELVPGKDFIVAPESTGAKANVSLEQMDSITFVNRKEKVIVRLKDKLTWSVSPESAGYTLVEVDEKALEGKPEKAQVNIENKLIKNFEAVNVVGYVKGTAQPDSFLFITAHYDHLGGMGKHTYFPGANDNASGISLLLQLAHYYAAHPAKYSIGFICFAGEEIGLLGSKYFTENPLLPLNKIRFLTNTDLAGTGVDGITVVNATEFPKEFAMMNEVNDQEHLIEKINARGKAQNSDHYFFSEKGVPAFFFYTMGSISAYHDIFDKAETLPLNEQADLMQLVIGFNKKLMGE